MRSANRTVHAARAVAALLCMLASAGCATVPPAAPAIENVSAAKQRATAYHDDGSYQRDLAAATAPAEAWLRQRASQVPHPALVLDIDETSLSNWAAIKANDYGYIPAGPCDALPHGPCGWVAWEQRAAAPAITSTLRLYRDAEALHVAVFFITGRHEVERPYTERNLRAAGYTAWQHLYMEPDGAHFRSAADFKAPIRDEIEQQHYTIIADVGDQVSDLAGGHAEHTFKLPNPFYIVP